MNQNEILLKIRDLEEQIFNLPIGSLTIKTIKGKRYYYHRWYENKKRKEKYIPTEDASALQEQIQHRKLLEDELKILKNKLPSKRNPVRKPSYDYVTNVLVGESLRNYSKI